MVIGGKMVMLTALIVEDICYVDTITPGGREHETFGSMLG